MTDKTNEASIDALLTNATQQLQSISDYPLNEARSLLAFVLDKPPSYLITWPEAIPKASETLQFKQLISRRQQGEPIAYLLNTKAFWTLDLAISKDTLIPRADTEILVEYALGLLPTNQALEVLDLGTGSGAIALSIASERPDANILATDASPKALDMARLNQRNNDIKNVSFLQSNWFENINQKKFDMILSNPPYIPRRLCFLNDIELKYEPEEALFSGESGLDDLRVIIDQSRHHLHPNGTIILEHGYDQGSSVRELLNDYHFTEIGTRKDFAGHDRISYALFQQG